MQEAILTVACWLYRRFVVRLREPPFCLVSLADARLSEPARQSIWQKFAQAELCCLPPGMARRLHEGHHRRLAADVCADSSLMHLLSWFASLWTMQCADVEWRHGRNRQRTNIHGKTALPQFSAKFVNAEMRANLDNAVREMSMLRERRQAGPGHAAGHGGENAAGGLPQVLWQREQGLHYLRAPTAKDLLRFEIIRRARRFFIL